MTTQIQIKYKPTWPYDEEEIELVKFQNDASADKFLASIQKNPDVAYAKKL